MCHLQLPDTFATPRHSSVTSAVRRVRRIDQPVLAHPAPQRDVLIARDPVAELARRGAEQLALERAETGVEVGRVVVPRPDPAVREAEEDDLARDRRQVGAAAVPDAAVEDARRPRRRAHLDGTVWLREAELGMLGAGEGVTTMAGRDDEHVAPPGPGDVAQEE